MKKSMMSTSGGTSDTMGDIDASASLEQVPGVYKPSAKNDVLAGMDIDDNHGGVNDTKVVADDAASTTSMTMHSSSAPTPKEMGIS